jgi:hypothetical protein
MALATSLLAQASLSREHATHVVFSIAFITSVDSYLLIAQPQSSSTSTAEQLGHMAGLRWTQTFPCYPWLHRPTCRGEDEGSWASSHLPCEYPPRTKFSGIASHSDVCEVNDTMLEAWVKDQHTIHKQHLTPTRHHVNVVLEAARAIPDGRVLLLTRSASGSAHARCERALHPDMGDMGRPKPGSHRPGKHLSNVNLTMFRAAEDSLLAWQRGWLRVVNFTQATFHSLSYEGMQEKGRGVVLKEALRAWQLPQKHAFVDLHARLVNQSDEACAKLT